MMDEPWWEGRVASDVHCTLREKGRSSQENPQKESGNRGQELEVWREELWSHSTE
ncbi:cyclin J like [Homo sapiens]|uniref:Cyclin J like n=1 Tax=Homo sapiens TaxID=9606 RepID=A0A2R8Y754_HUMAN|nr:cyclin J like [Homo sapiens]KAI4023733.1 cyclin J like [Homo sapiens]